VSKFSAFAILTSAIFLFFAAAARAALPVSINTTRIEINANPGDHVANSFTFWNGTEEFLPVNLAAGDVIPSDEEGHVTVIANAPEGNSLKEWIHPEYPQIAVAPKTEFDFKFSVDVPTNADPGTHYGVLLVSTAPVTEGAGAAVQTKIGPIILVKVSGIAEEHLALETLDIPDFLDSPPIPIEARFKNAGTVHEAPEGRIEVRNTFGGLVATCTLPGRNVLPAATRKIETQVTSNGLWLGRYTINLTATYGADNQQLRAERTIWIIPWKTQGWKSLAALALIIWIVLARRRLYAFWHVLETGLPPPQGKQ